MTPLRIRSLSIYRLAIPMRFRFEHAAAARDMADPVVVAAAAGSPYAEYVGYGETLARTYVTGENATSVVEDLANVFAPRLAIFAPDSFAAALEFIEALPVQISGRIVTAARAAFELALIDLVGKVFRRRAADVAGWMGLPGFGPPGALEQARYSGVVVGRTRGRLAGLVHLQRLYGLRDFKIKVGTEDWEERLAWAHRALGSALRAGRATLRADANGTWTLRDAQDAAHLLKRCGVSALEQPLQDRDDPLLAELAQRTKLDLIADESLITMQDAERLIRAGGVKVFNIRLAKNGGLLPALRLARAGLAAGLDVQLGCLVGETSILSAAGIGFLEACPRVRFAEGAYGKLLLRADVVRRPVRFGRGGRIAARGGFGLGVAVEEEQLQRVGAGKVRTVQL